MSNSLIDLYTEEAIRKILTDLYGVDGSRMEVNENVALIIYSMLEEARQCTSSLNMIEPLVGGSPVGTVGNLSTIAKNSIKKAIRSAGNDKYAISCLKISAANKKAEIREASYGL